MFAANPGVRTTAPLAIASKTASDGKNLLRDSDEINFLKYQASL